LAIESNRTIGGVAAILTLLGIFSLTTSLFHYIFPNSTGLSLISLGVSGIFGVLAIVGFLLFLIAMYGFSNDYNERRIFSNLIYGILFTIVAGVVVIVIFVLIVLLNLAILSSTAPTQVSSSFSRVFGLFSPVLGLVGVVWTVFVVRAFNLLADKSKVPLFKTGAKLLLAGALVNIVIAIIFAVFTFGVNVSFSLNTLLAFLTVGSLIQDIGWVFLAMAYFRIQTPVAPMQAAAPINAQPVLGQVKYCPYCGAQNPLDAVYCTRCGRKL
jgi:uncharacterized membrane protein/ribosomal protein L40E